MLVPVYDIVNCGPRHRFSANGKIVHNCDFLNVQNLPNKRVSRMREAFRAPSGQHIVVVDSSQIELRMNMWFCGQHDKLELLRSGGDIYKAEAASQFNIDETDVNSQQRQYGKIIQLGCLAEGTQVLTHLGLVPIEDVTPSHMVWDGVEWVHHDGVIYKGYKEVITYDGLTATPDHKVWTEGHRDPISIGRAASEMERLTRTGRGRTPLRLLGGEEQSVHSRKRRSVYTLPMRLWDRTIRKLGNTFPERIKPEATKAQVFDILNAGPRNRFTANGRLVSNCGYRMGAKVFRQFCAAGPLGCDPIYLSDEEAWRNIYTYRQGNANVAAMWKTLDKAIYSMAMANNEFPLPEVPILTFGPGYIVLPSGRRLKYPNLSHTEAGWVFEIPSLGKKRNYRFLHGGTLLENIIQAMARDVVFYQELEIAKKYRTVATTHDEVLFLAPIEDAEEALAFAIDVFSVTPEWAPGLPLSAEGAHAPHYCK